MFLNATIGLLGSMDSINITKFLRNRLQLDMV